MNDVQVVHPDNDPSEKVGKIRRSKAKQAKIVMAFIGVVILMVVSVVVKMKHNKYSDPRGLRRVREYEGERRDSGTELLNQNGGVAASTSLPPNSIYRLSVKDSNGAVVSLAKYAGMVTLVVNVACKWGKTAVTYTQLKELQTRLEPHGFSVLAFPSNDFRQEYESDAEIQSFLEENFEPNFPVFGISELSGNPVYQQLQRHVPDASVKHNFFKYLVNRQGIAVHLYSKKQDPLSFEKNIEELIGKEGDTMTHQRYVTH